MAISKTMRAALHTLSYPGSVDLEKTFKLQRALEVVKAPLSPLHRLFDEEVERDGKPVRLRLYTPKEDGGKYLLLFFHGGGWVHENVDTYDRVCKNLSKVTGSRVISVEYSRAPEHFFPEAVLDCYAAARAVCLEGERFEAQGREVVLIGDSAGGNLAAATALMARDKGEIQIARQILIYPATWNDHSENSPFPSIRENGEDFLLTSKRVEEYMEWYAGTNAAARQNPYFAPLLCDDLSNLPRALVITAQYDPLRDEGEAYAQKLQEAGGETELHRMAGALHGYFSLSPRFKLVRQTCEIINRFLNDEVESCPEQNETC